MLFEIVDFEWNLQVKREACLGFLVVKKGKRMVKVVRRVLLKLNLNECDWMMMSEACW